MDVWSALGGPRPSARNKPAKWGESDPNRVTCSSSCCCRAAASNAASSLSLALRWASLPPLAPLPPIFPAAARAALKSFGVPARGGRMRTLFSSLGLLLFLSMRLKESHTHFREPHPLPSKAQWGGRSPIHACVEPYVSYTVVVVVVLVLPLAGGFRVLCWGKHSAECLRIDGGLEQP